MTTVVVPSPGDVGWYASFETTDQLDIGAGSTSTSAGRTTSGGKVGSYALSVGISSSDEISMADPAAAAFAVGDPISVEFAIYAPANAFASSDAYMFRVQDDTFTYREVMIAHHVDSASFELQTFYDSTGGESYTAKGTITVPYGALKRIAMIHEGGQMRLYLDQVLQATTAAATPLGCKKVDWLRSGYNYNAAAYNLDELRVCRVATLIEGAPPPSAAFWTDFQNTREVV